MEETLPLEKDLHESERNAFKFQVFPKTTVNTSNGLMDLSALCHLCKEATVANAVSHFRDTGEQQYKMSIPAFTPMGICTDQDNPKRSVRTMRPTELVMIDLDDVERSHDGLKAWVDGWIAQHREEIQQLKTTMVYITCSGKGVRVIFPRFEQLDILQSAQLYCQLTQLPSTCLDKQCVDISRLSILTTFDDIVYTHQPDTDDEGNVILNQATDQQLALFHLDKQDNTQATYSEAATSPNPFENKPFKEYTEKDIIENDLMYGDFKYKGRQVKDIVREYISWRTNGMGPEGGARHLLYNQLCKNFRNLCDNDPRILHAILPSMGHPTSETWKQAVYFCSLNSSSLVPRNFYFWLKERGYMEYPDKDEEEEDFTPQEEKFYAWALKNMPPLPPIMKEIVNNAPYWFKLPILSVMESYLSLICTNYRSHYIDGFPVSLSSYNIIYAPQGSGKSMSRRVAFLIEEENKRDKLALMKAQQYDSEVRKANGSSENPEEPKWKQRLFAARTSLGEIMKRQEAIGNHHWLQDVSEFSM